VDAAGEVAERRIRKKVEPASCGQRRGRARRRLISNPQRENMGGDLFYIPEEKRTTWIAEVEAVGFIVEDHSDKLSEADAQTFAFVGKLKNGTTERFIQLQELDSGYVLAVRFAGKDDPAFLQKTLGSRFAPYRFEVKK